MDFSTINVDFLKRCPIWKQPSSYRLSDSLGSGCAGDAPGYPSYFLQSIYTQHGNNPSRGPQTVICYEGIAYVVQAENRETTWDDRQAKFTALIRRLWKPLPLDHERTRLWISATYKHHNHCYNGFGDSMLVYPVPDYKLKSFQDDTRWNDEYRAACRAEAEAFNRQAQEQAKLLAVPENHNAVRIIRKFYPDYQPELNFIENPPLLNVGQWWETEAKRPTPQQCAKTQRWGHKHPFNGTWCQWCGWKE